MGMDMYVHAGILPIHSLLAIPHQQLGSLTCLPLPLTDWPAPALPLTGLPLALTDDLLAPAPD